MHLIWWLRFPTAYGLALQLINSLTIFDIVPNLTLRSKIVNIIKYIWTVGPVVRLLVLILQENGVRQDVCQAVFAGDIFFWTNATNALHLANANDKI
ncbi:hypothetical protein GQX74_005577 [Glossina fuscipes]|nr:hypothetical protein GQX74_005577 [Glossina fuscipes]